MRAILILTFLLVVTFQLSAKAISKKDFETVVKKIQQTSMYPLTQSEIYEGAIKGVLEKIEQKSSPNKGQSTNVLLSPSKLAYLKTELQGEIVGIGVSIKYDSEKNSKYPLIIRVLEGGAKQAGLRSGDEILKVDGLYVAKIKDLVGLVRRIRGPVGSVIKLSILRNGDIFEKSIKRKKIPFKSVETSFPQKGIGYIKIKYFNKKTFSETKMALNKMKDRKLSACIMDLRENSGGLFAQGVKTLKLFSKKNDILFKIKHANGKFETIKSDLSGQSLGCKWAILVDEYTRSMGEAFVSSFKRLKKATVIGSQTFGKASMETLLTLKNGYAVKYTISQLYDINGKTWANKGLTPDIPVSSNLENSKEDVVLQLAVKFLSK